MPSFKDEEFEPNPDDFTIEPALPPVKESRPLVAEPPRPDAAAVLERKPSRYDNIEKELRVPSYVRRADVKLVTDNSATRKEVYNDHAAERGETDEAKLF